jgi:membrane-associated phospholipid phosphatase
MAVSLEERVVPELRDLPLRCPVLALLFLFLASFAFAGSDGMDTAGDIGRVLIPAAAGGITLVQKDYEGTKQLVESVLAAAVVTEGLKYAVRERRPNGGEHSFPSGHASVSFAGATFLQARYGWTYGVPALLAAAFVGYTRVESDEHWTKDVVGGAAIGIASGLVFTSRYRREAGKAILVPVIGKGSAAVALITTF